MSNDASRWWAIKAEEYRRKAEEAEKQLAAVEDERAKASLRNSAFHWRLMAERAECAGR